MVCTGTADVDALVAELGAKEDGNFRLFGYVGEVNASVEALRGKMREVSAELERWQGANAAQDSDMSRRLEVCGALTPKMRQTLGVWIERDTAPAGTCRRVRADEPSLVLSHWNNCKCRMLSRSFRFTPSPSTERST